MTEFLISTLCSNQKLQPLIVLRVQQNNDSSSNIYLTRIRETRIRETPTPIHQDISVTSTYLFEFWAFIFWISSNAESKTLFEHEGSSLGLLFEYLRKTFLLQRVPMLHLFLLGLVTALHLFNFLWMDWIA